MVSLPNHSPPFQSVKVNPVGNDPDLRESRRGGSPRWFTTSGACLHPIQLDEKLAAVILNHLIKNCVKPYTITKNLKGEFYDGKRDV